MTDASRAPGVGTEHINAAAWELDLEALTEGVITGEPRAGAQAIYSIWGVEIGIWEMTPGAASDVEEDEIFVVLSGLGSIQHEDGSITPLHPGRLVRLHAGHRNTWHVTHTIRKVYLTPTTSPAVSPEQSTKGPL
ncbi:cupin domain-containing protein [Mycobacteroides salmoniphilum]|uniref:(S)-ureidoglycine aminohydrolase cupin domain-containing protein n=1 Tax=Mycobacteroides salmoniphilum TaxID=404941 RepID=A0A4R8SDP1_9MYCO|nr:cupin domain-containing protein [Mycobacteroides salmoniphilum]TDZ93508.1 hypothetical protein CCUG60885_03111 [Mycobacteroides salmoniphilum]TEA09291.1 hypothetical protein CCUG60883_00052 [Mycobacteroides salmoniphilum]